MTHSKSKIQNPKLSLPRYPRYKDSGVEWLGEVPEHWEVQSLRTVAGLYVEKNQPDLPVLSVYREYGVILKDSRDDNHNATSLDTSNYKVVRPGDLAVNKMKAWQGSLGVSEHHGIVSPAYITCRLNQDKVTGRYIHYLLRSQTLIGALDSISYGVRVGQWDMRFEDFKKVGITIPPKPEQDRIVAFLDQKTAEIDALIAKKQRQIELLDEQKAILINRAVTRGIVNAEFGIRNEHLSSSSHSTFTTHNSKFSPSGIEWIGDIPEHWEVVAFRRLINAICDGPFGSGLTSSHYSDSGTRVIRLGNIGKGTFKNADKAFIPDTYAAKLSHHKVVRNDLLVAGLGDSNNPVGRACVYERDEPAIVKADCYRVRLKDRRLNGFIAIYLSSQTGAAGFSAATRGSTRSRVNLVHRFISVCAFDFDMTELAV
ncbi:MAG: hypothetical protein RLZZ245_594 [Verrucomicrobiota bacterium]|jgi:type I restriction enzyme S subunit